MNRLIRWSIDNRLLVIAASALLVIVGVVVARDMPVDVFPDLTAPTVTIVTEAHGLANTCRAILNLNEFSFVD